MQARPGVTKDARVRRAALWSVSVLALAGGLWLQARRGSVPARPAPSPLLHPVRPETPPAEGGVHRPAPDPELPPNRQQIHTEAYQKAIAAGDEHPGEQAFRATVTAFLAHNRAFAEAQAAEEGLSMAEVSELTYFGFLVLQTQQWPEIEALTGREVSASERDQAETLMHDTNAAFKTAMRKLVADKAPEEARWRLLRDMQDNYKRAYFALTGMNAELLDDLMAGDPSRPGAPSATPVPKDIKSAPPPEPVRPRPELPP